MCTMRNLVALAVCAAAAATGFPECGVSIAEFLDDNTSNVSQVAPGLEVIQHTGKTCTVYSQGSPMELKDQPGIEMMMDSRIKDMTSNATQLREWCITAGLFESVYKHGVQVADKFPGVVIDLATSSNRWCWLLHDRPQCLVNSTDGSDLSGLVASTEEEFFQFKFTNASFDGLCSPKGFDGVAGDASVADAHNFTPSLKYPMGRPTVECDCGFGNSLKCRTDRKTAATLALCQAECEAQESCFGFEYKGAGENDCRLKIQGGGHTTCNRVNTARTGIFVRRVMPVTAADISGASSGGTGNRDDGTVSSGAPHASPGARMLAAVALVGGAAALAP